MLAKYAAKLVRYAPAILENSTVLLNPVVLVEALPIVAVVGAGMLIAKAIDNA